MTINRRALIASLPFAATAAIPALASATQRSALAGLIETHQIALASLERLSKEMDEAENTLNKDEPIFIGPFKHGWSMTVGETYMKDELSKAIQKQRNLCGPISTVNPVLGAQVRQELDACEAKAVADIERAFVELEDKYHINAIHSAWTTAEFDECKALMAVCSYPCQTADEYRARGQYLCEKAVRQSMDEEHQEALLLSMAG